LLSYLEYSKIKSIEDQMPVFLQDLAESQKVGLTLNESLKQAAQIDYGRLSPEIKKIYHQLSWGVPVRTVFDNFARRTSRSKLIGKIIRLINESYISGGDIGKTMEATASDITAIKEAEKQRRAVTSQHVFVMYAIYFIFIGIVLGLSQTLLPMLEINLETGGATGGIMSFSDPCFECTDKNPNIYCLGCVVFKRVCNMLDMGEGSSCYYNGLFVVMVAVQGIFSGLVAGQLGEGSVIAGVKHSVIMFIIGVPSLVLLLLYMS
jgi:flagellar protein FlaJ